MIKRILSIASVVVAFFGAAANAAPTLTPWEPLGGELKHGPSCLSRTQGTINCFVTGTANNMVHIGFEGGWLAWDPQGGDLTGPPLCLAGASNVLICFAHHSDGRIQRKSWHGGSEATGWSNWSAPTHNPGLKDSFTCVRKGATKNYRCVARSATNEVLALDLDRTTFTVANDGTAWASVKGGKIDSHPECLSGVIKDSIHCFGRGLNGTIWWTRSQPNVDPETWADWKDAGGEMAGPYLSCTGWSGRYDCFVRAKDNTLRQLTGIQGQGTKWTPLGGKLSSAPDCVSWGKNRIDCFARWENGQMFHRAFDGTKWWDWESRGGQIVDRPECISRGENLIDCFAIGTNKGLYRRWWDGAKWGP